MSPKEPAERQLERILYVIPVAAREGGAPLADLARELGVSEERIVRDLTEVTAREPPLGEPMDVDISIEGGRVQVWTTGEFGRPAALSPRESLALALGLRLLAEEDEERRDGLLALAGELDRALASMPAEPPRAGFELDAVDPAGAAVLGLLRDAARVRRPCRLEYLKPDAAEPETRKVHPYAVVFAGGGWYALGWSAEADAVRAFRLDRILEATALDGGFEVPDDFDHLAWVEDGVLFRSDEEIEAVVRYSPRIARWLRERGEGEAAPDGSVVVRHRVADPGWLVRHVLAYGPEAEVLEPVALRDLVARRVEALAEG